MSGNSPNATTVPAVPPLGAEHNSAVNAAIESLSGPSGPSSNRIKISSSTWIDNNKEYPIEQVFCLKLFQKAVCDKYENCFAHGKRQKWLDGLIEKEFHANGFFAA